MGVRAIQIHGRSTTQVPRLSPAEHAIPVTWPVRLAPRRAGLGAEQQVVDGRASVYTFKKSTEQR